MAASSGRGASVTPQVTFTWVNSLTACARGVALLNTPMATATSANGSRTCTTDSVASFGTLLLKGTRSSKAAGITTLEGFYATVLEFARG